MVGEDTNIRLFKTNPIKSETAVNKNGVGVSSPTSSLGLVLNHTITYKNCADFYLLTPGESAASKTGFVPTYFRVIYDSVLFEPEKLQWLTYKLCHLHYNAPGPVRMPAQVQYALELARFWSNVYRKGLAVEVRPFLEESLYFL